MFAKILVPLDGSELAARILSQVAELAGKCNSQLILLHVCRPEERGKIDRLTAAPDEKKICEAYLSLIGKELQNQKLTVQWICVEGDPAREIITYADENDVDLIAMATHGKGEVAWLIGSTAQKVVTHATVPVMLFRILHEEPPILKEHRKEFI